MEYTDDFEKCEDTYVTLLVDPDEVPLSEVSFVFGLEPTRVCEKQSINGVRAVDFTGLFHDTPKFNSWEIIILSFGTFSII
ncbi:hypothetical protein OS175_05810 [Marinicella sp. S1101]|uniref:hypothetical protein n=1 Tax=Marinicella marina TaxID=2996016 RepID=UPI002260F962|nr:hypothetical protein [Marinicella marina]MCX7553387.1 hypothetical protein [Marinicella marina]MDJ1139119.1 hypothetical protein [Marinicella marina]